MKRLAGGERCFVVGGAIVGRVVGEPTTPSSWPTGSSTLFTTGQPSELSALYRGGASSFAYSQDTNHHNCTWQKLPDHTKARLIILAHSIQIVVS